MISAGAFKVKRVWDDSENELRDVMAPSYLIGTCPC